MGRFFKNNGLSIVFAVMFFLSLWGQALTGWGEHNQEIKEMGSVQISFSKYLTSGHFLQATFENNCDTFYFPASKRLSAVEAG